MTEVMILRSCNKFTREELERLAKIHESIPIVDSYGFEYGRVRNIHVDGDKIVGDMDDFDAIGKSLRVTIPPGDLYDAANRIFAVMTTEKWPTPKQ